MPQKLSKSDFKKSFGYTGTEVYNGYITEEDNAQWRDTRRVEVVEQMRRQDGMIAAVLKAVKTPILSTTWHVEGEDEKLVEFVENHVMNMKSGRTWQSAVAEMLTFLEFGFSVFEKIYGQEDGLIVLQDLAPRIQSSIDKWELSNGEKGVVQLIRSDQAQKKGITNFRLEIPWEKLLVLTNDKEGDDYTGIPLIRAAYKHYKIKDVLYRIQGISAERYGVGIPYAKMTDGIGDADKDAVEEMLTNMRSNEKAFIIQPPSVEEIGILTPNGNPQGQAIIDAITHHNQMILNSCLASFLSLGDNSVGSFALSANKVSFFLKFVEDKACYMEEMINKNVVEPLIRYNFGNVQDMPKIRHASITEVDKKQLSEVLSSLAQAGLIQANKEVLQHIHKTLSLPDYDEGQAVPEPKEEQSLTELVEAKKKFTPPRTLTMYEEGVNFEYLNNEFDDIEQEITEEMVTDAEKQIERVSNAVEKARTVAAVTGLVVSATAMKKATNKGAKQSYAVGKKSASGELDVDEPKTPAELTKARASQADQIANTYKQELENTARNTARQGLIAGVTGGALAAAVRREMRKKASTMIANVSGSIPGEYVNKGRREVFEKNASLLSYYQRSEVLDSKTCNMCRSLDKRVVEPDDPMAKLDLVHTNCRGIWIPVMTKQQQPEKIGIPTSVKNKFNTVGGVPVLNSFTQLKKPIDE